MFDYENVVMIELMWLSKVYWDVVNWDCFWGDNFDYVCCDVIFSVGFGGDFVMLFMVGDLYLESGILIFENGYDLVSEEVVESFVREVVCVY